MIFRHYFLLLCLYFGQRKITIVTMIELFDPDIDVLAYVSTEKMTNIVIVKQIKEP